MSYLPVGRRVDIDIEAFEYYENLFETVTKQKAVDNYDRFFQFVLAYNSIHVAGDLAEIRRILKKEPGSGYDK